MREEKKAAPAAVAPVVAFEDPRVQKVYELLCSEEQPPQGEHWEGFVARRIVDALAAHGDGLPKTQEDLDFMLHVARSDGRHSALGKVAQAKERREKAAPAAVAVPGDVTVIDWADPVAEMDAIMTVYEQSMGKPAPDAEMAQIVLKTKAMLFDWWGHHREAIRAALLAAAPQPPVAEQEPVGFQVWWGLGTMRPHWPPFKTRNEAEYHASMIKSATEVRPLYDLPAPQPAPVAQGDALTPGLIAAAEHIEGMASGYIEEHARTEPDTGAVVFDRRDAGLEYHSTLIELADDLRQIAARAQTKEGGSHA